MKKTTKAICLLLALGLLFSLSGCGRKTGDPASGSDIPGTYPSSGSDLPLFPELPVTDTDIPGLPPVPASGSDISSQMPDSSLPISVMTLNGTTGFGMAKLMDNTSRGLAALNYSFSVESDVSNVTAALINGDADIAALPTNAAAALYNKTEGGIKMLVINTLGVLYLVADTGSESVSSLSDLAGKTVYCPAQNPSFIFSYICSQAGVDVTIDTSYAQPADLRTAVAAGEVALAVLPEPMVTIACSANESLAVALDLTEEWDRVAPEGSLVQGCVVVRSDFAQAHPAELRVFLEEYNHSLAYLVSGQDDVGQLIADAGIFPQAAVAQKAVAKCNICYIDGKDMAEAMGAFVDIMLSVQPQSVGGAAPGDDFYLILD